MHILTILKKSRIARVVAPLLALVLVATGCTGNSSADKETASRSGSYDQQVATQPAHTMPYSPTREVINFWIDTWKQPNKLSYVYLQNANGDIIGYYVLKGLPVSSCAALTPTQQINGSSNGNTVTSAPSVDGVYYSGGQCNTYYGKDATSGAYIEYTVGLGINVLLFDQPLRRQNLQPLGKTQVDPNSGRLNTQ
jgi:hypothetical protein